MYVNQLILILCLSLKFMKQCKQLPTTTTTTKQSKTTTNMKNHTRNSLNKKVFKYIINNYSIVILYIHIIDICMYVYLIKFSCKTFKVFVILLFKC